MGLIRWDWREIADRIASGGTTYATVKALGIDRKTAAKYAIP
jgi:hypothetical protein